MLTWARPKRTRLADKLDQKVQNQNIVQQKELEQMNWSKGFPLLFFLLFLYSADFVFPVSHTLNSRVSLNTIHVRKKQNRTGKRAVSVADVIGSRKYEARSHGFLLSAHSVNWIRTLKLSLRGSARTWTPTSPKQHVGAEASNSRTFTDTQPPDSVHRAVRPSIHGAPLMSVPSGRVAEQPVGKPSGEKRKLRSWSGGLTSMLAVVVVVNSGRYESHWLAGLFLCAGCWGLLAAAWLPRTEPPSARRKAPNTGATKISGFTSPQHVSQRQTVGGTCV